MASSRNHAHRAVPRSDGHGFVRCSMPTSLPDSYPAQSAENKPGARAKRHPSARYASGQESRCLRDQFDPECEQKKPPRG